MAELSRWGTDGTQFVLGQPRYDQNTYKGRLLHFLDVVDPRTLLVPEAKLQQSLKLLDDFKAGRLDPSVTNNQLWQAQKIKFATIHPDTNEKIFMPLRMAGFVPFGSIIITGMLLPNPSTRSIVFWQWLNQSHNAGINYANRNASSPTAAAQVVVGYVGAVSTAVALAVVMHKRLESMLSHTTPGHRQLLQRFVPYSAVACANMVSVVLMRYHEIEKGIEVKDRRGNVVGMSSIAAKMAILQTVITRMVLPIPILLIPPMIMRRVEMLPFWEKYQRVRLPIHATVCTAFFAIGLPLAISLFPQQTEIQTSKLEVDFLLKTREKKLYFNRGL